MGKIGPKFSHLLTVRAEGADPPPPYGQPDCKNTVFLLSEKYTIQYQIKGIFTVIERDGGGALPKTHVRHSCTLCPGLP